MDAVQRWLTLLTLVSAALAALLYLTQKMWRGFRIIERLAEVVQHELSPNSGSSMKDDIGELKADVASIAIAVGEVQVDVADLRDSKQTAHDALQVQLDSIVDELGIDRPHPGTHRKERER